MQPCSWRGNSTIFARVNGLITLLVERLVLALDVGRQRHVAMLNKDLFGCCAAFELQNVKISLPPYHLDRGEFSAIDCQQRARLGGFTRLKLREHFIVLHHSLNHYLDSTTRGLMGKKPRGNHARIVKDQQVFLGHKRQQIGETTVSNWRSPGIETQKPTLAALFGGVVRDEALG